MMIGVGNETVELPLGTVVSGRYRIDGLYGRGGFGITYRALDTELERVVALKELYPAALVRRDGMTVSVQTGSERDNYEQFLSRFEEEAKRLARVSHPNVVQVYDRFRANGTAYLVMESVEGRTVKALVEAEGALTDEARVRAILEPLLSAAEAVHGAGLIHRDLNPTNIILRARDGQPVLLDFGIARPAGGRASTLAVAIYPGYAPNEQYGQSDTLAPSADIYGLAALGWLLVTGSDPLAAPHRFEDDLDPLGKARDKVRGGGISPEFLEAIDWGLARYPKKRPQSVAVFRQALGRREEEKASAPVPAASASSVRLSGLVRLFGGGGAGPEPAAPSSSPLPVKPPFEVLKGRWPEPGCVFRDWGRGGKPDPTLPELVVIPAGSFMMGSPAGEPGRDSDEGPQHPVTIARPFALGRYAVTQAEWQAVMGSNLSHFKGERLPVERVSWNDAQEFLGRLNQKLGLSSANGYRLPSEAEWEYACRAGTTTPFCWGDTITTDQANYDGNYTYNGGPKGNYRQRTVPVDSFVANAFGLYQMHGNVWEWCEDCWHNNYNGAPSDSSVWVGNDKSRVLRGGSWYNAPLDVRSAGRSGDDVGDRSGSSGFRLARTVF